jgi:hypothetical protein
MAFVKNSIDSNVQLELLLLLFSSRPQEWTAEGVARELRIDPGWVQTQLIQLCERNLLHCVPGNNSGYQYQPATAELDRTVADLARAYADRRVSIISLIYSNPRPAGPRPADPLKSFSDAFRIRKDKPHG